MSRPLLLVGIWKADEMDLGAGLLRKVRGSARMLS